MQAQYTDIILLNKWEEVGERELDLVLDHVYEVRTSKLGEVLYAHATFNDCLYSFTLAEPGRNFDPDTHVDMTRMPI